MAASALAVSLDAKEDAACALAMAGFKHDGATVAEMQQYANCVQRVHPEEMPDTGVWVIKAVIGVLLLAAIVGAVQGFLRGGSMEWFFEAMFYSLMAGVILLVTGLFGYALWFLFSA